MRIYVYPTHELLFEWPYFQEATIVQDLFLSEIKSCDSIDDADLAFFPLTLATAFQHQRSQHHLATHVNVQYEWRNKWSKFIQNKKIPHFVLCSYVLFNVKLDFLPPDFFVVSYECEVTLDIKGTLGNFGCGNRMVTIPYYVEESKSPLNTSKWHDVIFIGHFDHAQEHRKQLIQFLTPIYNVQCHVPVENMNYVKLYGQAKVGLVLRGDTPTRRAFYQCLLAGCCPLIYRHCLIHYQNLFRGYYLPIEQMCLVISDDGSDACIVLNEYLHSAQRQEEFLMLVKKHRFMLDYNYKIQGVSAPIYYALRSMIFPETKNFKSPLCFMVPLSDSFHTNYLPTTISSRDVVKGQQTSQYELEIIWHQSLANQFAQTHVIEQADVVLIPFYSFLAGWNHSQFQPERIAKTLVFLMDHIKSWTTTVKPHLLIYSDVMWDNSVLSKLTLPKNTIWISLESIHMPGIRCLTSPYISGFQQMMPIQEKSWDLCYIGRFRKPFAKGDSTNHTMKLEFIEMEGWKSINEETFLQRVGELYGKSTFSLQPPGDRMTRRGFFQSLFCHCVPVVFRDNVEGYQQHTLGEYDIRDLCIVLKDDVASYTLKGVLDELKFTPRAQIMECLKSARHLIDNYIFGKWQCKPITRLVHHILSSSVVASNTS